jgi:transcriptional regulator with XRE-family HTH domain
MQHRGEIIKEAVYKSGFPITELAKRMGKSRRWLYLLFDNPKVSIEVILEIGSIIHYNFAEIFAEIKAPEILFTDYSLISKKEDDYWKDKYLNLLEEHLALLKKM